MNDLSPFEYILGLASITALISIIDMVETLRLFILILTAIGMVFKLIEQYQKSKPSLTSFVSDIKEQWKKLRKKG